MTLQLKLYSSTLSSPSSSLPLLIKSKPFYEVTLGDMSHSIQEILGKKEGSPYPQYTMKHQVLSLYLERSKKYVRIDSLSPKLLLQEAGIHPGTVIHV